MDRPPLRSKRLLDQLRERIRYAHYSLRTERTYVYWARYFIRFHGTRHPETCAPRKSNHSFRTSPTNALYLSRVRFSELPGDINLVRRFP